MRGGSGPGDVVRAGFVAESYLPRPASAGLGAIVEELRRAADLYRAGPVVLIRCVELPDDELCSWTFEAMSEAAVRSLTTAVDLDLERVSRAVERWPRGHSPDR
jgi:hypothetical protein